MINLLKFTVVTLMVISVTFCDDDNSAPGSLSYPGDSTIVIVDQTGKEWDITHAVHRYGLERDSFMFGLGPNAFTPVNMPEMLSPGQEGYPPANQKFRVIGVSIEGDARAYPITPLSSHEVVNDSVGGVHLAVTY